MIDRKNLVHWRDWQGPWTSAGELENMNVRQGGNVENDPRLLHFVVEFSGGHSGDFNLGVEKSAECIQIVAIKVRLKVTSLRQQLEPRADDRSMVISAHHQVCGVDECVHRDEHGVMLGANQFVESGSQCFRRSLVVEQGHTVGGHQGPETCSRGSLNFNAVSRGQLHSCRRAHIDGFRSVLNKQKLLVPA